mmetsp:Transcript_31737/g.94981  ORF Transcript_31737/g.94981 Transcript_31737/m.94981 type:complete len:232 (-) Transcript_31737:2177-2872(-)
MAGEGQHGRRTVLRHPNTAHHSGIPGRRPRLRETVQRDRRPIGRTKKDGHRSGRRSPRGHPPHSELLPRSRRPRSALPPEIRPGAHPRPGGLAVSQRPTRNRVPESERHGRPERVERIRRQAQLSVRYRRRDHRPVGRETSGRVSGEGTIASREGGSGRCRYTDPMEGVRLRHELLPFARRRDHRPVHRTEEGGVSRTGPPPARGEGTGGDGHTEAVAHVRLLHELSAHHG